MAKSNDIDIDKGSVAEEALRLYFQNLGAYVVRGAKVRAGRDHVTDIDLWVYTRGSVHARNISIVDIKNKRKSKGYERLIWLKGLQSAVGADEAIVATPASKDDLRPFASRLGIRLLSAQVFKAVIGRYGSHSHRLSSEELEALWRPIKIEGAKDLAALMESCLVEISLGLSFTAMNIWLDEASRLLTYCYDHERNPGAAIRAVLMLASLIAICADYMGRTMAFADTESRKAFFREGILFGKPDEGTAARYIGFAEKVATDFVDSSGAAAAKIRHGFNDAVSNLPVGPLIDFFARPSAGRDLLDAATQLEAAAFDRNQPTLAALPPEGKTVVALLIDYAGLDRKRFLVGNTKTHDASPDVDGASKNATNAEDPKRPNDSKDQDTTKQNSVDNDQRGADLLL